MADIIGTSSSETIDGTSGSDNIEGRGGDDWIDADGGNDRIDGGTGDDVIFGGSGDDVIIGGTGFNDLYGESGFDTFTVSERTSSGFSDDLIWDFTFDVDQVDLSAWGVSDFSQVEALLQFDDFGDATLNAFYAGHDHWLTFDSVDPRDLISSDFIYADPAAFNQRRRHHPRRRHVWLARRRHSRRRLRARHPARRARQRSALRRKRGRRFDWW